MKKNTTEKPAQAVSVVQDEEIDKSLTAKGKLESDTSALVVKTKEHLDTANDLLGRIRDCYKAIKARLDHHLKPLQESKRSIDEGMRRIKAEIEPRLDELEALGNDVKGKMGMYFDEQRRLAAEEQARIDAENRKKLEKHDKKVERAEASGKEAPPPPVLAAPTVTADRNVSGNGKTTYTTTVRDAVYTSANAQQGTDGQFHRVDGTEIPNDYWVLDTTRIGKVIRAGGTIPGVGVNERTVVAQRG